MAACRGMRGREVWSLAQRLGENEANLRRSRSEEPPSRTVHLSRPEVQAHRGDLAHHSIWSLQGESQGEPRLFDERASVSLTRSSLVPTFQWS